jgi:RNA polymerase sigma-70 factor (ECF subfamily)
MEAVASNGTGGPGDTIGALFAAESSMIFGYLLVRCGVRSTAEEITAQTFEAAVRHLAADQPGEVTGAWLRTVARRRLVDHWRRAGAERRRLDRLVGLFDESTPPPDDPDTYVDAVLGSLPDRQRAALLLRYCDDFAVNEVAEALQLSYKATESLLSRARQNFAACYDALTEPAESQDAQ